MHGSEPYPDKQAMTVALEVATVDLRPTISPDCDENMTKLMRGE